MDSNKSTYNAIDLYNDFYNQFSVEQFEKLLVQNERYRRLIKKLEEQKKEADEFVTYIRLCPQDITKYMKHFYYSWGVVNACNKIISEYREVKEIGREFIFNKRILDVCCGSKMFWFDKNNPNVVFMDNRQEECSLCDGRTLKICPDIVGDFRCMPFDDETFNLVVFDPPHLLRAGDNSWLAKKYGKLSENWKSDLEQGFQECMRVLKEDGVLIFKWNEEQIKLKEILSLIPYKPLFGNRRSSTHWIVFMKGAK